MEALILSLEDAVKVAATVENRVRLLEAIARLRGFPSFMESIR